MSSLFAQSELIDLIEKVESGERLDLYAGIRLMNSQDILALGYMANLVREQKNGNRTYFRITRQIKDTNVTPIFSDQADLSELQLMGGLNSEIPFESYVEMLHQVSESHYLEIQEAAHRLGMHTNAIMFYGHAKSIEEQIDYLLKLRELQDRTGGFQSFMPLYHYPKGTKLEEMMGVEDSTGFEDLKMLAVSRILLDNVDHIQAFGSVLGPKLTQVSMTFGVDFLDSHTMTKRALIHLIEKAGREPVEQDTFERVIESV